MYRHFSVQENGEDSEEREGMVKESKDQGKESGEVSCHSYMDCHHILYM